VNSSLNAALEILGILGPLLAAVSAVFLIRSSRSLTPFLVAKLAGTFWNYNPHLLASLSEEAALAKVGNALLMCSIICQFSSMRFLPPSFPSESSFIWAVAIAFGILVGAEFICRRLTNSIREKAHAAAATQSDSQIALPSEDNGPFHAA
jgi:hypothetical protein